MTGDELAAIEDRLDNGVIRIADVRALLNLIRKQDEAFAALTAQAVIYVDGRDLGAG